MDKRIKSGKYIGKKYGKYTVLKFLYKKPAGKDHSGYHKYFLCRCECGNEKPVFIGHLLHRKDMGCRDCVRGCKGNISKNPLYNLWHGIRSRCYNKNHFAYKYYGGRGIKICQRWQDPKNFIEDMSPRPEGYSIDRINNDGNYEPSNCRWASPSEQQNNQRHSKDLTASNLAKLTGYSGQGISRLYNSGIIKKYVIKTHSTGKNAKHIYSPEAIKFLKNLRKKKLQIN